MKKALFLLILVGIAGGAGYYFFFLQRPFVEKIFPENTTVYMSLHSVREARENFSKTLLAKKLENSPRKEMYGKQLDRLKVLIENATGVDPNPLARGFTRELSIGAFPVAGGRYGAAFVGYVVHEGETEKYIEQQVDPNLKRRIPDLIKSPYLYEGITINRYNSKKLPPDIVPCYAVFDHHLFVGATPRSLETLIDVKKKKQKPLAENALFEESKRGIKYTRGALLFVNAAELYNYSRDAITRRDDRLGPAILQISGIAGVESLIYNVTADGEGFGETGFLGVKEETRGLLNVYLQQKPRKLESLQSLPANSNVVTAGTLPNFARMWDEINSQLNRVLSPEQFDRWEKLMNAMKGIFNFDIRRDLLEPIGEEFAFCYESGKTVSTNPADLKYLLVMHVRKPDQILATLDRAVSLAALRGFERKQAAYKGKNVQVISVNLGNFTASPAYYMDGSWLFLSTDFELLKRSIDSRDAAKAITANGDFQKVTDGFPEEVNGLSYTNVQSYLKMYSAILRQQADRPENRWMREYSLNAELDYLASDLFGAGSFTRIEEDGVHFRSYSSVPAAFLMLPAVASSLPQLLDQYRLRRPEVVASLK